MCKGITDFTGEEEEEGKGDDEEGNKIDETMGVSQARPNKQPYQHQSDSPSPQSPNSGCGSL